MRIAPSLQLTAPERQQLAQWARGRRTPARLVLRAKIALLAAEGHTNQHIAGPDVQDGRGEPASQSRCARDPGGREGQTHSHPARQTPGTGQPGATP